MKLVRVVRSQFSPPGQLIVGQFDDEHGLLILPPETSDEILTQAEQMAKAHNDMERALDYFTRILAAP